MFILKILYRKKGLYAHHLVFSFYYFSFLFTVFSVIIGVNFIVDIPKNIFEGPDVPKDILQVGASLPMQDQEGNPMDGTVMEIGDETVKMDFNHPLAGEALNFKGSVVAIRDASQEELDHGHVHGEGGVQH